ncbi:MAG: hypothetical protein O3A01_05150, partial [bacterium]|nr:hypothetical protein [bacterium]
METRTIQDNAATNAVTNQTTICVLGYGDILAASVKEVLGVGFDVVSIDNVQNLTELNAQTATIMVCDEVTLGALSESVQVSIVNKFAQFKWLVLTHNPDLYQWTLPVENWNKGAHYFTIRK